MDIPTLETERLKLVPLSLKHLSMSYVNWLNDREVYKFLDSGGNYTLEMLEEYLGAQETDKKLFWAIHIKSSNLHIGNIKVDPINKRHNIAEFAIMMGEKTEWGKGYGAEASKRVLDYCFNDIGLRKITLGLVEDNIAALSLYKKLGFVVEGVYKNHGLYDGKYRDVIRMAVFNPHFSYGDQ